MAKQSHLFGPVLALVCLFTQSAYGEETPKILYPKIQGKTFEINCDRDLPEGRPTREFLSRLDAALGHTDGQSLKKSMYSDEIVLAQYRRTHPDANEKIIEPAIAKCEL